MALRKQDCQDKVFSGHWISHKLSHPITEPENRLILEVKEQNLEDDSSSESDHDLREQRSGIASKEPDLVSTGRYFGETVQRSLSTKIANDDDEGKPHGFGVFLSEDRSYSYFGPWDRGERCGVGLELFKPDLAHRPVSDQFYGNFRFDK